MSGQPDDETVAAVVADLLSDLRALPDDDVFILGQLARNNAAASAALGSSTLANAFQRVAKLAGLERQRRDVVLRLTARDVHDRGPAAWGTVDKLSSPPEPPLPEDGRDDDAESYDPLLDMESPPCPPGCTCPECPPDEE